MGQKTERQQVFLLVAMTWDTTVVLGVYSTEKRAQEVMWEFSADPENDDFTAKVNPLFMDEKPPILRDVEEGSWISLDP